MSARLSPFTTHMFMADGFRFPYPQLPVGAHPMREMSTKHLINEINRLLAAHGTEYQQPIDTPSLIYLREELRRRR